MRSALFVLFISLCVLWPAGAAHAHRVNVFAHVEGERAYAEGYFADGSPCQGCAVRVIDAHGGGVLVEGSTDGKGKFSFGLPAGLSLEIVIEASPGHTGRFVLDATTAVAGGAPGVARGGDDVEHTEPPHTESLHREIEEALDRKLAPVLSELRRLRQTSGRPGITEVIGGIGYIVGLMGLAAYLRYRKR